MILGMLMSYSWIGPTDALVIMPAASSAGRGTCCGVTNLFSLNRPDSVTSADALDDDASVNEEEPEFKGSEPSHLSVRTRTTSFDMTTTINALNTRRRLWKLLPRMGRKLRLWKDVEPVMQNQTTPGRAKTTTLTFPYDYDIIELIEGDACRRASSTSDSFNTTGVLLIHPIGVGIAKWFYQRLISSLSTELSNSPHGGHQPNSRGSNTPTKRLVVVAPDLLGSGSACNATVKNGGQECSDAFPLFNISDWTDQVMDLMAKVDANASIDRWCVVANGGCSPIALQAAARSVEASAASSTVGTPKVSNVILSSVPRLPFFLPTTTIRNDPRTKVAKSYRTLCGIPGTLFWWYACRNRGSFIQRFSERNLVADPMSLGETWQSNCYETATGNGGRSRYSTFAFLAGTLQDGCTGSLDVLRDSTVRIDIIKGADVRRNTARSWFWQSEKKSKKATDNESGAASSTDTAKPYETMRDDFEKNGNGGDEIVIGGRVSLAHEDSEGYAKAIIKFIL